jgi:penicillin-binding protein 1A
MRQPGSSFKPIVYASALASGIPPSRIIADRAFVYEQVSGELWTPENFSREFEGDMTLRHAFRNSVNTVAIRLAVEEVGLETVAQTARRLGIRTPIPRVPSIAIGSAEVLPIQMIEAYSAFATLGTKVEPYPILRVENDEGEVLWEPEPEHVQVMDPATARLMVTMMQDVVARGTGAAIRGAVELPYVVPAAGKTGTTNESTDLWFNGFTPNLQATVWFGMDQPQPLYAGATSGEATPVWGEFMRLVYLGELVDGSAPIDLRQPVRANPTLLPEDEAFELGGADGSTPDHRGEWLTTEEGRPTGLLPIPEPWPLDGLNIFEVDSETGLLASPWCPAERRYIEYYLPGTEPTEECDEAAPGRSILRWPW